MNPNLKDWVKLSKNLEENWNWSPSKVEKRRKTEEIEMMTASLAKETPLTKTKEALKLEQLAQDNKLKDNHIKNNKNLKMAGQLSINKVTNL